MATYAFGPYLFDELDLTLSCHGQNISLRPRTAQVLARLVRRAGQLISREQLLDELWPDADVVDSNVTQHVFLLRRLFAHYTPEETIVVTVPGRGYRFVAAVSNVQSVRTQGGEAWSLIVRGRFFADQRRHLPLLEALQAFEGAIAVDPDSAAAYAGIAECHVLLAEYLLSDPREGFEHARKAAMHALTLDATIAEAHAALGEVAFYHDWDNEAALAHYDRATRLDPAALGARIDRAWYFAVLRQPGRAEGELDIAARIEPFSLKVLTMQAAVRNFCSDFDFARRRCREVLEMDPTYVQATYYLACALAYSDRPEEALELLGNRAEIDYVQQFLSIYGFAAARAGMTSIAEDVLRTLEAMAVSAYVSPFNEAQVLVGLGRLPEARRSLERGIAQRDPWSVFARSHPVFAQLR